MKEDPKVWQSKTGPDARYALKRHQHSIGEVEGLRDALNSGGGGGGGGGEGFDMTADPLRIGNDAASAEDETKKFTINIGPGNTVGDGPYNTVIGQFATVPDGLDSVVVIGRGFLEEGTSSVVVINGYAGEDSNSGTVINGVLPSNSPSAISIGGGGSSSDAPRSVSIGDNSYVIGTQAVALGASAWANGNNAISISGTAQGERAIGIGGSAQAPNTLAIGGAATEEHTAVLGYDKLFLVRPGGDQPSVLVLKSPNGTKFALSVDDDGLVTTEALI